MRVLVVEDEPALGDVFRDFLLELGHQPLVVRSAEAALGKLRTERPDAIILDIHLPGMSGLDFLQHGEVRESGVPVVVMSGHATEAQALDCLRLGARDFMAKPLPLEHLRRILECLEPIALAHEPAAAPPAVPAGERRRAPRVRASLPVRVQEYGGAEWQATCVDLSVSGAKIRAGEAVRPGRPRDRWGDSGRLGRELIHGHQGEHRREIGQ